MRYKVKILLKPCPFCGSEQVATKITSVRITHKDAFYVECSHCKAQGGWRSKRILAERLWQKRV